MTKAERYLAVTAQMKCLLQHCRRKSLVGTHKDALCRTCQVDMTCALMKHLPREGLEARMLFLTKPHGQTWFMDWVRLVEGMELYKRGT